MQYIYSASALESFCADIFFKSHVPILDAEILAQTLVRTDMRGVHSHGVVRISRYLKCVRAGGINPNIEPSILAEGPNFTRYDGRSGLGIPLAMKAVRRAVDIARQHTIGLVTVNHSDHFGAAGHYALYCAEQGMIGITMSNTCPLVAVTGSAGRVIGNNPLAYAVPAQKYRAVLYDVSMSVVASGKVELAHSHGERIPFGWILDPLGNPTTDPRHIYQNGAMLPFGGHKGYGLAVLVEVLAGALASAGILDEVKSWNETPGKDANTGHCFIAINIANLLSLEAFRHRIDDMITRMIQAPRAVGVDRIYYPGEIEFEREAAAEIGGIRLPDASVTALHEAADMVGLPMISGMKGDRSD